MMIEQQQKKQAKKMLWITLAMMAFSTVWGFGNVVNGYVYFDGTKIIFSWILMFLLYFIPYALMVGELSATFKDSEGGVSSWVNETMGVKWAYYAGWTYSLYWFEHPLELKEMRQKYRDYGKTLSVKRSAKIALGNLEGLVLK